MLVGDVRGLGLLLGLEIVRDKESAEPAKDLLRHIEDYCLDRGLILFTTEGTPIIRLAPPLVITRAEIDTALSIMEEAIAKAKTARTEILANMAGCLAKEREEMSPYAPRIVTIQIDPSKIGELIGPGGKNIKRIVEESGCEINIEDDGRVLVYSMSAEGLQVAKECIDGITAEVEVGKLYRGKVVSIKDFGCFVEVLPGKDGLVHISELANFRVKKTEDIVKDGDEIWVKCIGVDDKGRIKLSRKAAMEDRKAEFSDDEDGDKPASDDSEE